MTQALPPRISSQDQFHLEQLFFAAEVRNKVEIKPSLQTSITKSIHSNLPFIHYSSDSNTVIQSAQRGLLGIIPSNLKVSEQSSLIRSVKRYQSEIVTQPITVTTETSIAEVIDLQHRYTISAIPVINSETQLIQGIVSKRDIIKSHDTNESVSTIMTKEVITFSVQDDIGKAKDLMNQHNIEQIVLIDSNHHCVGLITRKDMNKINANPYAIVDKYKRLLVGAAINCSENNLDRISLLIDEQVDVLVVENPFLQIKDLCDTVTTIRRQRAGHVEVIAGPIYDLDSAMALMDAGATGLYMQKKLPCSVTEYGIAFSLLPHLIEVIDACSVHKVPIAIKDIQEPSDMLKLFALGINSVILNDGSVNHTKKLESYLERGMSLLGCSCLKTLTSQTHMVYQKP